MILNNRFKFTLVLPKKLHNDFKLLAYNKGITVSEYLRNFMQREVEKHSKGE